jgi:RNA polymerase sigma-70 factor, ECF subfamily
VCSTVHVTGPVAGSDASDETYDETYHRELPAIVALTVAMTGDREAGVDLAQEAMLRAYRAWSKVGRLDRPGAWIRRVAINLALDARKRRRREQRGVVRLAARASDAPAHEPTDEQFWDAVRALPERQRAAVALHYLEDMAVADVAEVLDVAAGTVKSALFAARRTLAAQFGLGIEERG